jgi:hypothetical protein
MSRFKRNAAAFAGGFRRGFTGTVRTARRLVNTATLGALDQALGTVAGATTDFRPLSRALGLHGAARRPDARSMRNSSLP